MANELKAKGTVGGGTMTAIVIRASDGWMFDTNDNDYSLSPTAANAAQTLTEVASTGRYVGSLLSEALVEASDEIKVEYVDTVPGSFAWGDVIVEREVIAVRSELVVTRADNAAAIAAVDVKASPSQPRQNNPAGRAFQLQISSRNDGTHKAKKPVRLRAGSVGPLAVSIDMLQLFGGQAVTVVGTPTVAPSGTLTATALGPRDTEAMVDLGGTATASQTYVLTVPVTMEHDGPVDVDVDVITFSE